MQKTPKTKKQKRQRHFSAYTSIESFFEMRFLLPLSRWMTRPTLPDFHRNRERK